jgi:hypothetical protein
MSLLSFVGGAAKQFVTSAEQAEEDAKQMAKSSFNGLYKRYEENAESNRELTNKMKAEKQYIETVWKNATPEQVNELLANPVALEAIKKTKNPSSVDLNNYIRVIKGNESKAIGAERAAILPEVMEKVKASLEPAEAAGSPIGALFRGIGKKRMETDMEKYARGMGMTLEQLRSSEKVARPAGSATFDMGVLEPTKTLTEQTEQAQLNMVDALRSNDDTKIDAARKELNNFTKAKEAMTPEQTKFANKVADIKNRYMFGTPEERKAAKPEYDKLMSDIRAEAMAKKTGEGDGEGKIPALSTLNTFTSAAVARAVTAKHGDLIKSKQLAIVEKADGSVGIEYIGDNDTLRRQILETQANAARNALSLYTDEQGKPFNRDVASVLNSFTSVVPSVVRKDGAAATPAAPTATPAPATPAAPVRSFNSVADAEAANLPKGTKITINGRPAEVQ